MKKSFNIKGKVQNKEGITLVALVITIVVMIILASIGINIGKDEINKAKLEDYKTTMLLIQGKAKTLEEKKLFEGEKVEYIGTEIADVSEYPYLTNTEGKYYKLSKENLEIMGIKGVDVTEEEFYIVEYTSGEVYYSKGYTEGETVYYSLSEMQNI